MMVRPTSHLFISPLSLASRLILPPNNLADITYSALANAFDQPLVHHAETLRRMESMYSSRVWVEGQTTEQRDAFRRMALFPEDAEVLYVGRDIWVVSWCFWVLTSLSGILLLMRFTDLWGVVYSPWLD